MNLSNSGEGWGANLSEYAQSHPDEIFIYSASVAPQYYTHDVYRKDIFKQNIVDLCNLPNVIIFIS